MRRVSIRRATANLPGVDVLPVEGLNVYSILQKKELVMTREAISATVERMQRPINVRFPIAMASSGLPIPSKASTAAAEQDAPGSTPVSDPHVPERAA